MWEAYSEYIIAYIIAGIVHFLICYGITYRKVFKYNKSSSYNKLKINWGKLIFFKGLFWPISLILDTVKIISTIGV